MEILTIVAGVIMGSGERLQFGPEKPGALRLAAYIVSWPFEGFAGIVLSQDSKSYGYLAALNVFWDGNPLSRSSNGS